MSITTYDDFTLIDPRRVALDDELRRRCSAFRQRPAGMRNALTARDLYVLLAFARRAAVFAMREGDAAWIADGLTAVAMLDDERIDGAEIPPTLALLRYAATRLGSDDGALFAVAAKQATRSVARTFARRGPEWRHDLLAIARELRAVFGRIDDLALVPETTTVVALRAGTTIAFVAQNEEAEIIAPEGESVSVREGDLTVIVVAADESPRRFIEPIREVLTR